MGPKGYNGDMLDRYEVVSGAYDEALTASGGVRPHYRDLLETLAESDLAALAGSIKQRLAERGVTFGASPDGLLALDPVPRLLTEQEWPTVRDGVAQRARALDRFVADVYGEQAIVSAQVVPRRVIEGSENYEPAMRHAVTPKVWVSVVGFDLVRCPDGRFQVLEDQIRMPSGIAYAVAAREILSDVLPMRPWPPLESVADALHALAPALREASLQQRPEPSVVLVSDGPDAAGWYEHVRIARELDISVVTVAELERRGTNLYARSNGSRIPVDVVYLRTEEDRLTRPDGRPTEIGELLLEPCRAGSVACVNAPGAGIGDDKLIHAYAEEMIGFYLAETPILESITTYDLTAGVGRAAALADPGRMVFKPRAKMGGEGVVVWSQSNEEKRNAVMQVLERSPEELIAQERAQLSLHPTLCGVSLEPRRVDLRPYVIRTPERETVFPGGLTRVALEQGGLIVNSGQGGGVKDTWIVASAS